LYDVVTAVHQASMITFEQGNAFKMLENHLGSSFIYAQQALVMGANSRRDPNLACHRTRHVCLSSAAINPASQYSPRSAAPRRVIKLSLVRRRFDLLIAWDFLAGCPIQAGRSWRSYLRDPDARNGRRDNSRSVYKRSKDDLDK
jgi:hypothetical protein